MRLIAGSIKDLLESRNYGYGSGYGYGYGHGDGYGDGHISIDKEQVNKEKWLLAGAEVV